MSYEALARRWRPRKFEDMLGQEHVLRALTNALDQDRLHHAYLFTGTRGVGKTTIARIFAKSLNCEKGVSSKPCGECSACQQVDEGRFLDLIEVDAASRTGVDDTRELLDNVAYTPSSGRYKVYLIDEVHMFSKSSFNALLKTLEEPPPHVKFLLATTDPQKLPVTVLSRCLQFNLKEMPDQLLRPYLADLLDKEKVEHEELAVAHIAQAADGSVRDALSLLDQAIAYGQGKINATEVEAMLGRFSPSRLYDVLDAVAADKSELVFQHIDELAAYVPDYSYVLGELLALLHQIATVQTIGSVQQGNVHDEKRLSAFAKQISAQDTQLWYQIGLTGRRDMPYAPNQRQALEMTLIRMLAFKPFTAQAVSQAKAAPATVAPSASVTMPAATADRSGPVQAPTKPVTQEQTVNRSVDPSATVSETPKRSARKISPPPPVEPVAATEATEEAAAELPPADINWDPADWNSIVTSIPVSGMPLQLARNCILQSASKDEVHLLLDPEYETLAAPRWKQRLGEKMSVYAEGAVVLKVSIAPETPNNTPAMIEKLAEQDKLEAARTSIAEDPLVAELVEKFDAEVSTGSIKPLNSSDQAADSTDKTEN